jgi:hypothetical protein
MRTNKEKQEAYRAKKAIEGAAEVRGIYLLKALHPELKAMAVRLAKRKPKPSPTADAKE